MPARGTLQLRCKSDTLSPMNHDDSSALPVDEIKRRLRAASLRCTASRIAVLQCLARYAAPAPASDISSDLHDFGFDKSTIYRSLNELTEASLITRLDLGDSMRRYELTDQHGHGEGPHPHFVCDQCGRVECLEGYRFRLTPGESAQALPGVIAEVLVRGRCKECAGAAQA